MTSYGNIRLLRAIEASTYTDEIEDIYNARTKMVSSALQACVMNIDIVARSTTSTPLTAYEAAGTATGRGERRDGCQAWYLASGVEPIPDGFGDSDGL